jgi:mannosyltransferase
MEAAGALGRGGLSTLLESTRQAVRSRSRVFWIVAGLTTVAGALRFLTLGLQSYHHDEIVTVSRILRSDFSHAMNAVGFSESAPPLYYALAWLWTQITGTGEVGLRSLSALAGVATVPVAYLIGAELRDQRAGIAAAALTAVNPMLVWYSQEARAYALLVLLSAISVLFFVRALNRGSRRDFTGWGIASGLALATHYFAAFALAIEAVWLIRRHGRSALAGLWIIVLAGLLLAPLAIHQMSIGHAEWIANHALGHRIWETGATFMIGETGDIIARPETPLLAVVPFALAICAIALAFVRGERGEKRAATVLLVLAGATVAIPLALALIAPSKDYVLARNLMPALVPLLACVSIGVTLRGAPRLGASVGVALAVYSLGFCVWANVSPALQRPDWDAVAARLGEPSAPRAMVTWALGEASLRYYLTPGAIQVIPAEDHDWLVHDIDFISDGSVPPVPRHLLGPGFRLAGYEQVGRLYIRHYTLRGPGLAPLPLRSIRKADIGFRTTGVLVDGVGVG